MAAVTAVVTVAGVGAIAASATADMAAILVVEAAAGTQPAIIAGIVAATDVAMAATVDMATVMDSDRASFWVTRSMTITIAAIIVMDVGFAGTERQYASRVE